MLPDLVDQLTQAPQLRCRVDWPDLRIVLARNQAAIPPERNLAHGRGDAAFCISAAGVVEFGAVMSDAELAALCNATELITELQWCDAEPRARLVQEDCGFQQRHSGTLRVITGVLLAAHASWLSELIPQRYPQVRRLGVPAAHCTAASIPPGVPFCTIQALRVDVAGLPDTVEELTISCALLTELVHLSALPKGLKVLCFQQLKTRLQALDLPPDLELDALEFRDVPSMNLGVVWGLEAKVKRLGLHRTHGCLALVASYAERKECGLWLADSPRERDSRQLLLRICSHLARKGIGVWELTTSESLALMFWGTYGLQDKVLTFFAWTIRVGEEVLCPKQSITAAAEARLSKAAGYACKLALPPPSEQPGQLASMRFDLTTSG